MTSIRNTNKNITRLLTKIEKALKVKLFRFYKQNILGSNSTIEELRQKYEQQVKNLIRKTIQDSYLVGTDIVTQAISEKDPSFISFISVTDIQNIQDLTEKQNEQFWKTSGRLHLRETEFVLKDNELEKKDMFDIEAAYVGVTSFMAYLAYNLAVESKMKSTLLTPNTNADLTLTFTLRELEGKFIFLTRNDPTVDPIMCKPLHRKVFDLSETFIPQPPLHNHCHCKLIPLVNYRPGTTSRNYTSIGTFSGL